MHLTIRQGARGALAALLALLMITVAAGSTPAEAQMGSGRTALTFLDALGRGDLDEAMRWLSPEMEIQTPDGAVIQGHDAVREYLTTIPLPLVVRGVLPWGGARIEIHLTAGGTPLVFLIDGGGGIIVFIEIVPDDGTVVPSLE